MATLRDLYMPSFITKMATFSDQHVPSLITKMTTFSQWVTGPRTLGFDDECCKNATMLQCCKNEVALKSGPSEVKVQGVSTWLFVVIGEAS